MSDESKQPTPGFWKDLSERQRDIAEGLREHADHPALLKLEGELHQQLTRAAWRMPEVQDLVSAAEALLAYAEPLIDVQALPPVFRQKLRSLKGALMALEERAR